MKKVCVMMTTYNPNQYFVEQIESILKQKNVKIDIIVRDDASSDKSVLYQVQEKYQLKIIEGDENLKTGGNILKLLIYVSENMRNYDYYAYSDQDDVWDENKLNKAIQHLDNLNSDKPSLYYSNLKVVDENLNFKQMLFKKNIVKNTFEQSLSQVFCFACTTVFNLNMIDEILKYNFNQIGFDSCLYYLGILNNNIYYDENSYIYYRQHGNNVSGEHTKNIRYYILKISHYLKSNQHSNIYLNSKFIFENFYQYLSINEKNLLMKIINTKTFLQRISLAFEKRIKAGYQPKDLFNFIKIILNKF